MLDDARRLPDGTRLRADVCIVGAGPAGITLALGLRGSGRSVILLESGGQERDAATQDLHAGDNVGLPLRFDGTETALDTSRLRQFGGTSNHWTGMCRPLDPHDFTRRDWLDWSGWPLDGTEMSRWYEAAHRTCELGPEIWGPEWFERIYRSEPLAEGAGVLPAVHQFSPPTRFGERYGSELDDADDVRVILWANAVDLQTSGGRRVDAVRARTLTGISLAVEADTVVLATGGVEVPRLLLTSNRAGHGGLGNANGLVGRCFMDHPHVVAGRAVFTANTERVAPYTIRGWPTSDGGSQLTWTGFALDHDAQRDHRIGSATVLARFDDGVDPAGAPTGVTDAMPQFLSSPSGQAPPTTATLSVRVEQRPDPRSRISLGRRTDALGMRRVRLDWRVGEFEWRTARTALALVGTALGAAGTGRVEVDPGGVELREVARLEVGNHHMGTTRMSDDPSKGVVDANCRLHEIENLYVAGSAVFPTSGAANPTLTIVALAHRLADHLRAVT